jgi:hypothetical protein
MGFFEEPAKNQQSRVGHLSFGGLQFWANTWFFD